MVRDGTLIVAFIAVLIFTFCVVPGNLTGAQVADVIESTCGNGVVELGEQCDDGNAVATDSCNACKSVVPVCGNRIVEGTEQCDLGPNNLVPSLGCSKTCVKTTVVTNVICGDGIVQGREQCDDGGVINADGCSSSCSRETPIRVIAPTSTQAAPTVAFSPPISMRFKQRSGIHVTQDINGRAVRRVQIVVPQDTAPVVLQEFSPDAQGLPAFSQPVYAAFEAHSDATLSGVLFTFIVDKSWFVNGRTPEQVVMYRHVGSWQQLRTALVAEDAVSYFYEAESEGLSYFIVSLKEPHKAVPAPVRRPQAVVQSQPAPNATTAAATESPSIIPKKVIEGGSANVGILLVVLIVLVLLGATAFLLKPQHVVESASFPDLEEALESFDAAVRRHDHDAAQRMLNSAERMLAGAPPAVRTTYSAQVQAAFNKFRRL